MEGFSIFLIALGCLLFHGATTSSVAKTNGPPLFFLQDFYDGFCLEGAMFGKCSRRSMWYVRGKAGAYQILQKSVDPNEEDLCLGRTLCHLENSTVELLNCGHCGTKRWNLLGDSESGFVVSQDHKSKCLMRDGDEVRTMKCAIYFSVFNLKFLTSSELEAMEGVGAEFVAAAAENNAAAIVKLLNSKVNVNSKDWDDTTGLLAASANGHLSMVNFLLARGANPKLANRLKATPLFEAASSGHDSIVRALFKAGAEVDSIHSTGVTPLWQAAMGGHTSVVEFLLSKNADPNNQRFDGTSVLMAACTEGHEAIVKLLLEHNVDVNVVEKTGLSALSTAAESGNAQVIRMLIEAGADDNAVSSSGFLPFHLACARGNLEAVEILYNVSKNKEALISFSPSNESATPLMYAAAGGHDKIVEFLINHGADVNARHDLYGPVFQGAAISGNLRTVELLLKAGASPYTIDAEGITPLMAVAAQGHLELLTYFLGGNFPEFDINQEAWSGGTPVMFAAGSAHVEATRFLIQKGADVNKIVNATQKYIEESLASGKEDETTLKLGYTALLLAVECSSLEIIEDLLAAGANVSAKSEFNNTALGLAMKSGFSEAYKPLLEHGADPNESFVDDDGKLHFLLLDAIMANDTELSLLLIRKGANVSIADEDGVTPLIQSSYMGQKEIVAAIVDSGVDVSVVNNDGVSALVAAASEGHVEIVRELVKSGSCQLELGDSDGTNALMAAAVRGQLDAVRILLEAGTNVNAQNKDGHTALMFAYNGKAQVKLLLNKYSEFLNADDDSLSLIQEALKTHADVIDLLLQFGSNTSIQDKSGHIASDFDFHEGAGSKEKPEQEL